MHAQSTDQMVIAILGIPFFFPAILSLNEFGDAMYPYQGNARGLSDIGRGLGLEAGDERNSNVVQGVIWVGSRTSWTSFGEKACHWSNHLHW